MKREIHTVDKFYRKGLTQRRIVFLLVKDDSGRFEIQRAGFTLLFFSKERQARIGFEILKGKEYEGN